jgi:transcriptional regulator with XRE-family HTH domain
MLYKKTAVIEDAVLLRGVNLSELSRVIGVDRSYLSRIKNNKKICSYKLYETIKEAVEKPIGMGRNE